MGNGYVCKFLSLKMHVICIFQQSWVDKMITRVRNVVKRDKTKRPSLCADLPAAKRKSDTKCKDQLLRRYPIAINSEVSVEDPDSIEVHKKAIADELAKSKPRDNVLIPLLKSIYHERRLFIQSEATCVKQIIERYPALPRRPLQVICLCVPTSCNVWS